MRMLGDIVLMVPHGRFFAGYAQFDSDFEQVSAALALVRRAQIDMTAGDAHTELFRMLPFPRSAP
jgi:hypothetical protein